MRLTYLFISAEIVLVTVDVARGVKLAVVTVIVEHAELLPRLVVTVVFAQTYDFSLLRYCVRCRTCRTAPQPCSNVCLYPSIPLLAPQTLRLIQANYVRKGHWVVKISPNIECKKSTQTCFTRPAMYMTHLCLENSLQMQISHDA